jgi:hypothetical protein
LKQKLYKSIWKIWDNEQLPAQWNEGIICPIKKKTLKCNNYRPITLLTIAYIVYLLYY